jgi:DNA-binding NtrC family response regulator
MKILPEMVETLMVETVELGYPSFVSKLFDWTYQCVLVVDDEQSIRDLIAAFLLTRGIIALKASNGQEALEIVRQQGLRPTLLISDLVMPEMGGIELLGHLRQQDPELPVLLMSGYYQDSIALQKVLDQRTQLLPKPFGFTAFAEILDQLNDPLDRQSPTRPRGNSHTPGQTVSSEHRPVV